MGDLLDDLLAAGSIFDWITPLVAFAHDAVNGPQHTLFIDRACGWSARQIEKMLRDHGVRTWGLMIVNDQIMITMRRSQARWADYLVQREGLPLLNPLTNGPVQPDRDRTGPRQGEDTRTGQRQPGGLAGIIASLERFLDS